MDLHECVGRVGAVTVRRIRFIDDPNPSVGDHPPEEDKSQLNGDGFTLEECQVLIDERDSKIKSQVDAAFGDLFGWWTQPAIGRS
jgi:hypothetical protein